MHRNLTLNEAIGLAHRIAEKHVERHKKPNKVAWYAEWDAYCAKVAGKYTDLDLRIIGGYAEAALRYDADYRTDIPIGLWAKQWGNVQEPTEQAA